MMRSSCSGDSVRLASARALCTMATASALALVGGSWDIVEPARVTLSQALGSASVFLPSAGRCKRVARSRRPGATVGGCYDSAATNEHAHVGEREVASVTR